MYIDVELNNIYRAKRLQQPSQSSIHYNGFKASTAATHPAMATTFEWIEPCGATRLP